LNLFEGILDHIVYQTNLYGTQKYLNLNIKPYKVLNFLGINFLMGYHRLPRWKHYWNCAPDLRGFNAKRTFSIFKKIEFYMDSYSKLYEESNGAIILIQNRLFPYKNSD